MKNKTVFKYINWRTIIFLSLVVCIRCGKKASKLKNFMEMEMEMNTETQVENQTDMTNTNSAENERGNLKKYQDKKVFKGRRRRGRSKRAAKAPKISETGKSKPTMENRKTLNLDDPGEFMNTLRDQNQKKQSIQIQGRKGSHKKHSHKKKKNFSKEFRGKKRNFISKKVVRKEIRRTVKNNNISLTKNNSKNSEKTENPLQRTKHSIKFDKSRLALNRKKSSNFPSQGKHRHGQKHSIQAKKGKKGKKQANGRNYVSHSHSRGKHTKSRNYVSHKQSNGKTKRSRNYVSHKQSNGKTKHNRNYVSHKQSNGKHTKSRNYVSHKQSKGKTKHYRNYVSHKQSQGKYTKSRNYVKKKHGHGKIGNQRNYVSHETSKGRKTRLNLNQNGNEGDEVDINSMIGKSKTFKKKQSFIRKNKKDKKFIKSRKQTNKNTKKKKHSRSHELNKMMNDDFNTENLEQNFRKDNNSDPTSEKEGTGFKRKSVNPEDIPEDDQSDKTKSTSNPESNGDQNDESIDTPPDKLWKIEANKLLNNALFVTKNIVESRQQTVLNSKSYYKKVIARDLEVQLETPNESPSHQWFKLVEFYKYKESVYPRKTLIYKKEEQNGEWKDVKKDCSLPMFINAPEGTPTQTKNMFFTIDDFLFFLNRLLFY